MSRKRGETGAPTGQARLKAPLRENKAIEAQYYAERNEEAIKRREKRLEPIRKFPQEKCEEIAEIIRTKSKNAAIKAGHSYAAVTYVDGEMDLGRYGGRKDGSDAA